MGFQFAGIGRLCSWDRSSAGGLAVLFVGVGFFCGTLVLWQLKSTYLLLEFRSCVVGLVVWLVKYGYSLMESVLRFLPMVVQPIWVGCCLISPAPPRFSRTLLVLLQVRQSPSSFLMSDAQEQHLSGKTLYIWWQMEYVLIMDGHGISTYMMSKLSRWRCNKVEEMQANICKIRTINKTLPN